MGKTQKKTKKYAEYLAKLPSLIGFGGADNKIVNNWELAADGAKVQTDWTLSGVFGLQVWAGNASERKSCDELSSVRMTHPATVDLPTCHRKLFSLHDPSSLFFLPQLTLSH